MEISVNGHAVLLDDEDLPLVQELSLHFYKGLQYVHYWMPGHPARWLPRADGLTADLEPAEPRRLAYLHRLIMGTPPQGSVVSYRNGNVLDHRRSNLVFATRTEVTIDQKMHSNNTSGVRGVSWAQKRQKWHARIQVRGRVIELGYFDDLVDATDVRQEAEMIYFGRYCTSA